jgi:sulfane dehydrogenase subunit SoxC
MIKGRLTQTKDQIKESDEQPDAETAEPFPMQWHGFGLIQDRAARDLTEYLTPERDLFRVWHLGIPAPDPNRWTLRLGGKVERPLALGLEDLGARRQVSVTAFHECAGNPLNPLVPQRRIGNVTWGGVLLSELLAEARPLVETGFVISRGVDHGVYDGVYYSSYEKDLPLAKALDPNVIVALSINGEPLPTGRGGPVRLVVPGYYATNSTKWLSTLTVSDKRSSGAFTTRYYVDTEQTGDVVHRTPVWTVKPNTIIVAPANGEAVVYGETLIWGWAWAAAPVERVDVSTDGGLTWKAAALEPRRDHGWQRFSYLWKPPSVGEYVILARATDSQGNVQPDELRRNRVYRVMIFVRAS